MLKFVSEVLLSAALTVIRRCRLKFGHKTVDNSCCCVVFPELFKLCSCFRMRVRIMEEFSS